jgi:hypothetical protein
VPLYLTIRYKDNLIPGDDAAGVPVSIYKGDSKWSLIGRLPTLNDHQWKTVQLTLPVAAVSFRDTTSDTINHIATYVFKIGGNANDGQIRGELPVDKIKLAATNDRHEFEADAPGLWPKDPPSRFADLGDSPGHTGTHEFIPGEGPFFPFGGYSSRTMVSDNGHTNDKYPNYGTSPTIYGTGAKDSWQIMKNAGLNTYVLVDTNFLSKSHWHGYPNDPRRAWAAPGRLIDSGLKEHLEQARGHGLKVIYNFLDDTRSAWIQGRYVNKRDSHNGEPATRQWLKKYYEEDGHNPTLLAMYPVDEFDHQSDTFSKPLGWTHLLYHDLITTLPDRPRMVLGMGWMGPWVWKASGGADAEMVGEDVYLYDWEYDGTNGHPNDHKTPGLQPEGGLAQQARRLDGMRHNLPGKIIVMLPESYDSHGGIPQKFILTQCYNGLCHGAQAILFFHLPHPDDPEFNKGDKAGMWAGITQMGQELFGPDGIAPALLPPARIDEFMGENGIVTVTNGQGLQYVLRTLGNTKYLIAVNITSDPLTPTFTLKPGQGLDAGKTITRRFSKQTIKAGANTFSDTIGPFERRVYVFAAP